MSRKKRKVDFAALASTSQSLLESVDAIKECIVNLNECIQGRSQEYEGGGAGLYARIARGEFFGPRPLIFDHAY